MDFTFFPKVNLSILLDVIREGDNHQAAHFAFSLRIKPFFLCWVVIR